MVASALILYVGNFIDKYAVNILYWDQWDYLTLMFTDGSRWQALWDLFLYQHGPHRMGVGSVVILVLAELTGWNTRADAFAVFAFIIAAMVSGVILKRVLFRRWHWSDFVIPMIFLGLEQYEVFIAVPNESLASIPIFLVIFLCLCWNIPSRGLRTALILVINAMLTFTGFGILASPIIIGLLVWEAFQNYRNRDTAFRGSALAAGVAILSTAAFFIQYHFDPAVSCFSLSARNIVRTPLFMGLFYSRYFGLAYVAPTAIFALVAGLFLLLVIAAVFINHLVRLLKSNPATPALDRVIVILLGYSLIFGLSAALGRVCLGLPASQAGRYVPFTFPAFLGLYLHVLSIPRVKPARWILILFVAAQFFTLHPAGYYNAAIQLYSVQKQNWKSCYLTYENIQQCNDLTGFKIYPDLTVEQEEKLDYLKTHHLNLYRGR